MLKECPSVPYAVSLCFSCHCCITVIILCAYMVHLYIKYSTFIYTFIHSDVISRNYIICLFALHIHLMSMLCPNVNIYIQWLLWSHVVPQYWHLLQVFTLSVCKLLVLHCLFSMFHNVKFFAFLQTWQHCFLHSLHFYSFVHVRTHLLVTQLAVNSLISQLSSFHH